MPFTFDGQWIPNKEESTTKPNQKPSGPVKVRLVKRKQSVVTVVLNLGKSEKEMSDLASQIKKRLGCGGAVKENDIEIQGDKVDAVKKMLADLGIKSS